MPARRHVAGTVLAAMTVEADAMRTWVRLPYQLLARYMGSYRIPGVLGVSRSISPLKHSYKLFGHVLRTIS